METRNPESTPKSPFVRWLILLSLVLSGCGADQATKSWARDALPGNPMSVLPNLLEFRYAENPAIAFSIFSDLPGEVRTPLIYAMSGIGLSVLLVLIWSSRHQSVFRMLPLALILAGAAGNLMDRFALGFVVDFVRVHWRESWSFPIFNLADSLISVGMALYIALTLLWPARVPDLPKPAP